MPPLYTYIDLETGEEKEITHSMSESPKIVSSKGNIMVKKICAATLIGFDSWGRSKSKK